MIRKCLKIEFYRLWHSLYIYLAIFIGCIVSLVQVIQVAYPRSLSLVPFTNLEYPYSVFNTAMLMENSVYKVIFLYIISILVVIPFGASYYQDLRSGYIRQAYIRTERRSWMLAKYITVFVSGAAVYAIPVIFNTVLTACFIPALLPQRATAMYDVFNGFLNRIFYTFPWIYCVIFLLIGMLYAGSLACLALAVAPVFHNSFFVLMTPIFLVFITDAVFDLFHLYTFRILHHMSLTGMGMIIDGRVCIGELLVLLSVGFFVFMKGGRKLDVY